MKNLFLAAALMCMTSVASFALTLTINCANSPLSIAPVDLSANGTLNCVGFPALPVSAFNISYQFQYGVDFTVDQFNAANPSITFSFNNPGTGLDVVNVTSTVGITGIVTVGPVVNTGDNAAYFAAFSSNFTSTVSSNITEVILGANFANGTATSNITNVTLNGRFLLNYDLPPTGIPEPSTVALMGAGLVGVAAFARRRR